MNRNRENQKTDANKTKHCDKNIKKTARHCQDRERSVQQEIMPYNCISTL